MKKTLFIIYIISIICISEKGKSQATGQWLDSGIPLHDPGTNVFDPNKWTLVFEEKFDGYTGFPTPAIWDVSDGDKDHGGSGSATTYKKHNTWVNQGKCTLTIKKEQATWNGENFDYTSGEIKTKIDWSDGGDRLYWEYGMFQARIKMPKAFWAHSNFWIYADREGEIDIAEVMARHPNRIPLAMHNMIPCTDPLMSNNCNNTNPESPNYSLTQIKTNYTTESPELGFHTYTCIWDKYNVYFYVENAGTQYLFMRIPKLLFSNDNNFASATEFHNYTTQAGYYWVRNCFYPLNEAGQVILHTFLDRSHPIGDGNKKLRIKQDAALPAQMEIDWVRIYKRRRCSQSEIVTNSNLFPYHNLSLSGDRMQYGNSYEKEITLGTQNQLPWTNIPTIAQKGGLGTYEAESITLLPNFVSKAILVNAAPCGPPLIQNYAALYIARTCSEGDQGPEPNEEGYIEPEIDTAYEDTVINWCEYIDTMWVDSVICDAYANGDSLKVDSLISFIVDSMGCEYWGFSGCGEGKPGRPTPTIARKHRTIAPLLTTGMMKIRIYPNPSTGSFNIEIPQKGNYTIRVMNLIGSTVYEGKMTDEQKKAIQLDQNLPPGNYTIHISGDGLRYVEKITLTR